MFDPTQENMPTQTNILKNAIEIYARSLKSEMFSHDREYFELPMNLEPVLQVHV